VTPRRPAYRVTALRRLFAVALGALTVASASCTPARNAPDVAASGGAPPHRIVSLVPSMTEDLFAVGAGGAVVGVSSFTDYPPQAKRLPVVATFASFATERIVALHADLALGITAQDRLSGDLRRAGVPVLLLHDDSYEDIFRNLVTIGTITGRRDAAIALVARLQARTHALLRSVKPRKRKPSVFVVLGNAPVFTVGKGSYIENLIVMAGGRNAASDINAPYARYSAEALVARQPDVLIVDPDVHLSDVLEQPPWNALRAVKEHRLYTLPNAAILERPGPRYNEGLSWLITTLNRATK
jgi:iron complex transport system substrate-binding protein